MVSNHAWNKIPENPKSSLMKGTIVEAVLYFWQLMKFAFEGDFDEHKLLYQEG